MALLRSLWRVRPKTNHVLSRLWRRAHLKKQGGGNMGINIEIIDERSFKEWFLNQFDDDDIEAIVQEGPEQYGAFIDLDDISMLYRRFDEEIWDLVGEVADTYYGTTVLGLLAKQEDAINTNAGFEIQMVRIAAAHLAYTHQ
jgi:hypothetical protein